MDDDLRGEFYRLNMEKRKWLICLRSSNTMDEKKEINENLKLINEKIKTIKKEWIQRKMEEKDYERKK